MLRSLGQAGRLEVLVDQALSTLPERVRGEYPLAVGPFAFVFLTAPLYAGGHGHLFLPVFESAGALPGLLMQLPS